MWACLMGIAFKQLPEAAKAFSEGRVPVEMFREHAERLKTTASRFVTQQGEILVVCDETRSQLDNRGRCIEKLKGLIDQATTRPKARRKTKPTRGSKERRLKEKKQAGERKNRRSWKPED